MNRLCCSSNTAGCQLILPKSNNMYFCPSWNTFFPTIARSTSKTLTMTKRQPLLRMKSSKKCDDQFDDTQCTHRTIDTWLSTILFGSVWWSYMQVLWLAQTTRRMVLSDSLMFMCVWLDVIGNNTKQFLRGVSCMFNGGSELVLRSSSQWTYADSHYWSCLMRRNWSRTRKIGCKKLTQN